MQSIILWIDKADPVLILKWGAIVITLTIVGDFILRAILFAIRIWRAVKPEGDLYIIK